jgi:hypothetical protein
LEEGELAMKSRSRIRDARRIAIKTALKSRRFSD